jgi:hypothetical protein
MDVETLLEVFFNLSLRCACFSDEGSSPPGKKQNFPSLDRPQVADYENVTISDVRLGECCCK